MTDSQSMQQEVIELISNLPKPANHIKECENLFIISDISNAIKIIKQDQLLSKFISSINSFYLKQTGTPLFSKTRGLDDKSANMLFNILYLYQAYTITPQNWKNFNIDRSNFKTLQCLFLFDWYRISTELKLKNTYNNLIAILPISIVLCELVLNKITINAKELSLNTGVNFNTLLKELCNMDCFDLLLELAKSWNLNDQLITNIQDLCITNKTATQKNEKSEILLCALVLFGFEFTRPIFQYSGFEQIFDFNEDIDLENLTQLINILGNTNENNI